MDVTILQIDLLRSQVLGLEQANIGLELLDRLDQIRDKRQRAYKRRLQIAETIRGDMQAAGRLIRTKGGRTFYFYDLTRRLFPPG